MLVRAYNGVFLLDCNPVKLFTNNNLLQRLGKLLQVKSSNFDYGLQSHLANEKHALSTTFIYIYSNSIK